MVKSGYALIDCTGLDLTKGSTPQTLAGMYNRLKEVMALNKPLVAVNCNWGGIFVTPVNVFAIEISEGTIIVTSSTLQIIVTNADSDNVTINNMVG